MYENLKSDSKLAACSRIGSVNQEVREKFAGIGLFALPVTCTRDNLAGERVSNRRSDRGDYGKRSCCSRGFSFQVTRANGGGRRRRIAAGDRSRPGDPGANFGLCSRLEHGRRYLATTD